VNLCAWQPVGVRTHLTERSPPSASRPLPQGTTGTQREARNRRNLRFQASLSAAMGDCLPTRRQKSQSSSSVSTALPIT